MNIYKFAAQRKLRFTSQRGELTIEQLFMLPLTDNAGFDLNSIAKATNAELKALGEEDFVETDNPGRKVAEIKLEIVKDVIATKLAEAENARSLRNIAETRKKLSDMIERKKDEKLLSASIEELEAERDRLG